MRLREFVVLMMFDLAFSSSVSSPSYTPGSGFARCDARAIIALMPLIGWKKACM